jgi:hypothetical protein
MTKKRSTLNRATWFPANGLVRGPMHGLAAVRAVRCRQAVAAFGNSDFSACNIVADRGRRRESTRDDFEMSCYK